MMKYKKYTLFILLQLAVFGLIPYAFITEANWFLILGLYVLFKGLGISFYFHRVLTHNLYTTPGWILSTIGFIGSLQPPAVWAAVHAEHHKHADTEKDPHSPKHLGWKVLFSMFHKPYLDKATLIKYNKLPCTGFFTKYYFHLIALIAAVFVLFPYEMAVYWALPVGLNLWIQNISVWGGHRHGKPSPQPWFYHILIDPGEHDHIEHHRYDNVGSSKS